MRVQTCTVTPVLRTSDAHVTLTGTLLVCMRCRRRVMAGVGPSAPRLRMACGVRRSGPLQRRSCRVVGWYVGRFM